MEEDVRTLAEALRRAGNGLVVAVTGAGVSAASGLPTFRGKDLGAIWSRDVTEVGTFRYFQRDPVAWWQWFADRFAGIAEARPNAGHAALVALERWQSARRGDFLLITQNIDSLHEDAGSRRLIKVHGSANRVRCSRHGCLNGAPSGSLPVADSGLDAFLADPRRESLPRCPACGSLLRPHALLFDEYYEEHTDYGYSEVRRSLERMALVLFVGTSFSVGVTELVLREALGWRLPAFSIDPAAAPPAPGITGLRAAAEEILPAVCRELGIEDAAPTP
ncbi:MAG TPA: Sir2 family NAD-dependent protein deacetylase [Thermoanaerobaculia bacterium]|nr:Sir2 family NAD-dependent protein deacetylase [Thermoanaerobaculia bacterium]